MASHGSFSFLWFLRFFFPHGYGICIFHSVFKKYYLTSDIDRLIACGKCGLDGLLEIGTARAQRRDLLNQLPVELVGHLPKMLGQTFPPVDCI